MTPGQLGAAGHGPGQVGSAGMGMQQAPPQALRVGPSALPGHQIQRSVCLLDTAGHLLPIAGGMSWARGWQVAGTLHSCCQLSRSAPPLAVCAAERHARGAARAMSRPGQEEPCGCGLPVW